MDIAGLSTVMSQNQLMSNISVQMLDKSLESGEQIGEDMVKMMEQSVNPGLGQNIDISL